MAAHYLHALDKESLVSKPLSEMEREDYLDKINSLTSVIEQFKESYSLLKVKSILNIDETWCRVRIPENIHLLCWAHVRAKFKYAEEISKDPDAAWFVEQIGLLYMVEAENIKLHRTVDEIKLWRSRSDVTKILAALYARAEKMIKNGKRLHYGDLMYKALYYMLNGWGKLQNYCMDGHYTIGNMIAERVIRPFTVNRKNSLFYSSEQGVDVASTYLTIIESAKMHGFEVRDYLVRVFREIMNGNEDCSTYAPEAFLA